MITSWSIYWITRLDSLNCFFASSGVVLLILFIAFVSWIWPLHIDNTINYDEEESQEKYKRYKRSMIWGISIGVLFLFISVFIPTTKEFAAIYLIPKIANNEQITKIPDNAAKLLNTKLEQWIDETLSKKKEENNNK